MARSSSPPAIDLPGDSGTGGTALFEGGGAELGAGGAAPPTRAEAPRPAGPDLAREPGSAAEPIPHSAVHRAEERPRRDHLEGGPLPGRVELLPAAPGQPPEFPEAQVAFPATALRGHLDARGRPAAHPGSGLPRPEPGPPSAPSPTVEETTPWTSPS